MVNFGRTMCALALALVPCAALAQEPPAAGAGQDAGTGGGRGDRAAEPEIRPYERVITRDAKSDEGIFTVHRIKDRLYYEIPKERLGREFLWVSQIAKTTLGAGYGGQAAGNRVVKWERRGDRILLRGVSYDVIATRRYQSRRRSRPRTTTRSSPPSTSRRSARTMRRSSR